MKSAHHELKTIKAETASSDQIVQAPGHPNDYKLAGVIGEQLSSPLASMGQIIEYFRETKSISSAQMQLLESSLESARTAARQSQQIARLATGRLRQSHERVKLDVILRDLLRDYAGVFRQNGVELYQKIKPVEVIVDPSLLSSLIDAALGWAVSMGRHLLISLELKNWPEHGLLLIKSGDRVATAPDGAGINQGENLGWYLLSETARAMGVSVEKTVQEHEISLLFEFSRTVKRLEGLTAMEVDTGFDSLQNDTRPMAGLRLLVITNDERLRMEVISVARDMSLMVDFAPTTAQGMRYCELDIPHMVMIDERVRDPIFDDLKRNLRRTDPNYPFVEIADASNTLEVAGWMSDSMTRLSRDALRSQLPSILALELAKVM